MLAHVLYHAQSWAQARITCLAYLAEKPVLRHLPRTLIDLNSSMSALPVGIN